MSATHNAQPNSSETPETDAATIFANQSEGFMVVPVKVARKLERERNALHTELEQVKAKLTENEELHAVQCTDLMDTIERLRAEVATLNGKLAQVSSQSVADKLCDTCGIGYYLPSGRCDHCNTQSVAEADALRDQLTAAQKDTARLSDELDRHHRLAADARAMMHNNGFGPNSAQQLQINNILREIAGIPDAAVAASAKADLPGPTP